MLCARRTLVGAQAAEISLPCRSADILVGLTRALGPQPTGMSALRSMHICRLVLIGGCLRFKLSNLASGEKVTRLGYFALSESKGLGSNSGKLSFQRMAPSRSPSVVKVAMIMVARSLGSQRSSTTNTSAPTSAAVA